MNGKCDAESGFIMWQPGNRNLKRELGDSKVFTNYDVRQRD